MATPYEKQAEAAKRKGNLYFKKEKLGAAIEAYTEAITLCPEKPIYWTNRALCERKRNEWEKVEADCRKALELDNKSVKGHYMLGLALLHYQQYGRAVAELEKAMDLGRGAVHGTSYMVEEIWQELAKARYTKWEEDANVRRQQMKDLQTFLQNLMTLDNQRRLKEITSVIIASENSLHNSPPPDRSHRTGDTISEDEKFTCPNVDGAEDTSRTSSSIAEEKAAGDRVDLYPPIYGQREDFDHTREDSAGEGEVVESVEENSRIQSARVEPENIKGENSKDQKKTGSPRFHFSPEKISLSRRKSLQIRLQKFMDSGHFQPEDVSAAGTNNFQQKDETDESSDDERTPYSMYDVYKVFKELVKLRHGDAGRELLRTTELYERRSRILNQFFKKQAAADIPGEVPDHLCCTITMEIFRDPVISPSGITYERGAIEKHLKQTGGFDPVTRLPLTLDQVYPNLAVRNAVEAYLSDHGWAYKT